MKQFVSQIVNSIFPKKEYIANIYKSNYSKRVLISYTIHPFISNNIYAHSSNIEAIAISKIFHNLGYIVDIIQYNGNFELVNKNVYYDIVFGLEPNFLKAVKLFHPKKSIYYATGAHYEFQNTAEQKRLLALQKRRGILLEPVRYVQPHESSSLADSVICIGNEWTKGTYQNKCRAIEIVRISAYEKFPFSILQHKKNWQKATKNFLWFGSWGAVHKGLDLLLDIFSRFPEINLYICGNIKIEKDFMNLYKKEMLQKNIHLVGWVNPDSNKFKKLCLMCGFVVLPSCSESMNGAVPTCMNAGLVPLVTKETGLDIANCGEIFSSDSIRVIENTIIECSKKSTAWLKNESAKAYTIATKNFTIDTFKRDFEKALERLIN